MLRFGKKRTETPQATLEPEPVAEVVAEPAEAVAVTVGASALRGEVEKVKSPKFVGELSLDFIKDLAKKRGELIFVKLADGTILVAARQPSRAMALSIAHRTMVEYASYDPELKARIEAIPLVAGANNKLEENGLLDAGKFDILALDRDTEPSVKKIRIYGGSGEFGRPEKDERQKTIEAFSATLGPDIAVESEEGRL